MECDLKSFDLTIGATWTKARALRASALGRAVGLESPHGHRHLDPAKTKVVAGGTLIPEEPDGYLVKFHLDEFRPTKKVRVLLCHADFRPMPEATPPSAVQELAAVGQTTETLAKALSQIFDDGPLFCSFSAHVMVREVAATGAAVSEMPLISGESLLVPIGMEYALAEAKPAGLQSFRWKRAAEGLEAWLTYHDLEGWAGEELPWVRVKARAEAIFRDFLLSPA